MRTQAVGRVCHRRGRSWCAGRATRRWAGFAKAPADLGALAGRQSDVQQIAPSVGEVWKSRAAGARIRDAIPTWCTFGGLAYAVGPTADGASSRRDRGRLLSNAELK